MNLLFALVPEAWGDLGGILRRRWWAALVIGVAAGISIAAFHAPAGGTMPFLASLLVFLAIWFVVFPEAMRIDDPAYVLDVRRLAPLALLAFFLLLIGLLVFVPVLLLDAFALRGGGPIVTLGLFFLVQLAFQTKFCFALYAADSTDSPIAFSWRVSGGRALLATAVLAIAAMASAGIVDAILDALVHLFGRLGPMANSLDAIARFVLFAFLSAWTIRWMRVAQAMQTVVPD